MSESGSHTTNRSPENLHATISVGLQYDIPPQYERVNTDLTTDLASW